MAKNELDQANQIELEPLAENESSSHWREDDYGQVTKGIRGMSRRQKAMKGVEGCDKLGEAVKQALIPGYPNHSMLNT